MVDAKKLQCDRQSQRGVILNFNTLKQHATNYLLSFDITHMRVNLDEPENTVAGRLVKAVSERVLLL